MQFSGSLTCLPGMEMRSLSLLLIFICDVSKYATLRAQHMTDQLRILFSEEEESMVVGWRG